MTPHEAVLALIAAGWSESRIAREASTSQPTVHRIKRGAMARGPSFAVSQAVIELAERVAEADCMEMREPASSSVDMKAKSVPAAHVSEAA